MSQSASDISSAPSTIPPAHIASPPSSPSSPTPSTIPSKDTSRTSKAPSASVDEALERLTTAVQENGHLVHVCTALCEERCALAAARDEAQKARALGVQEQLARVLAMTRETVRREREVRVTSDPQKYALDLQRAAFGAGGTPDSISRSSMMESD
ncbi:hypothetical protein C8Q77DRAFT_1272279 [Trametes polyzona]|nr:hypothetical protein C8Q77DRAFT_1272279 [Trametes polyzona]